jgi:hypothetical protein
MGSEERFFNGMEMKALCNQIAALVGDEDVDLCFTCGRVRVQISSGEQAETVAAFMRAVGKYLLKVRHGPSGTDAKGERADLNAAFELFLSRLKV